MMRLRSMTWRNWLIAAHDAVATAVAVMVTVGLRVEGPALTSRLPLLLWMLFRLLETTLTSGIPARAPPN